MNRNIKKCFSLIELLIVMSIIMILFVITVGLFGLVNDKISISKTEAIIKQISVAMQAYRADQGYYFMSTSTLQSLTPAADPVSSSNRFKFNLDGYIDGEFVKYFDYESLKKSGYIKTVTGTSGYSYIVDAWGRSLIYKCPGNTNNTMFDLGSLGKNGKYGDNPLNTATTDFGKGDDITNFNY